MQHWCEQSMNSRSLGKKDFKLARAVGESGERIGQDLCRTEGSGQGGLEQSKARQQGKKAEKSSCSSTWGETVDCRMWGQSRAGSERWANAFDWKCAVSQGTWCF